ncbi:MAG: hypothetical protein WBH21_11080, partial [Vibrio anguillarum]
DGTPLNADWGNDYVGFTDALLADAGVTANGLPDTVNESQRLDAVQLVAVARSLNLPTDGVILSDDTTTALDGKRAIYDVVTKKIWMLPTVGAGETIVSVVDYTLTTNAATYLLMCVDDINSEFFGARPSLTFDNTAALNAMFDFARLAGNRFNIVPNAGAVTPLKITIKPGIYLCNGSINATMFRFQGWTIEAAGAVIYSKADGKVAFDMLGSRHGTLNDLMVIGDEFEQPSVGKQIGRFNTETAGTMCFNRFKTGGYFTLAGVYNHASEVSAYYHSQILNYNSSHDSYAEIIDGRNMFDCQSEFVTIEVPIDTPASCIQHLRSCHDVRKPRGGVPIALVRCDQVSFQASYAVSSDSYAVRLFEDGNSMRDLNFDMHIESYDLGVFGCFDFRKALRVQDGPSFYYGFKYIDHKLQARFRVINIDPSVDKLTINNIDVRIDGLHFGTDGPANGFIIPADYDGHSINGTLNMPHQLFRQSINFSGEIKTTDASLTPIGKNNIVVSDLKGRRIHKGDAIFKGSDEIGVPSGELTDGTNEVVIHDGSIDMALRAVQPPNTTGTLCIDDGTNWSGVNPTGEPRMVFKLTSGWKLVSLV